MTPLLPLAFYLFTHCADLNYEITLNGLPIGPNPKESFSKSGIREIYLNPWLSAEKNILRVATFQGTKEGFCRFELKRVNNKVEILSKGEAKGYSESPLGNKVFEYEIKLSHQNSQAIALAEAEIIKKIKDDSFYLDWKDLIREFLNAAKTKNRIRFGQLLTPSADLHGRHLGLPEKWIRAKLESEVDELINAQTVKHPDELEKMTFHQVKEMPGLFGLIDPIEFEISSSNIRYIRLWLGVSEHGYFIKHMDLDR